MAARKRTKPKKSKNEKPIAIPMSIDEALRKALGAVPPEELNTEKIVEVIEEVARKKKEEKS